MRDIDSNFIGLQSINGKGEKRFAAGSVLTGGMFPIYSGTEFDRVYIAEGMATAMAVHLVSGVPVMVAFSANNILPVAEILYKKFKELGGGIKIIIAADNDCGNEEGNKGLDAAKRAAQTLGCTYVFPVGDGGESIDFNDLYISQGEEAVRECLLQEVKKLHLPAGYELSRDFLYSYEVKGSFVEKNKICGRLIVKATYIDSNGGHGKAVEFNKMTGGIAKVYLSAAEYQDKEACCRKLGNNGLFIADNDSKKPISDYIMASLPEDTIDYVSRTGWKEKIFIVNSRSSQPVIDGRRIEYSKNIDDVYKPKGNLTLWSNEVSRLARGNYIIILSVCAALASPLLKLAGNLNFFLHFYGASSTGKTTTLMIGNSVWTQQSGIDTWSGTANGFEAKCYEHNDIGLILDEIGQANAKDISRVLYLLCNGTGKLRANKNTDLRETKKWRLIGQSAGEHNLAGIFSETGTHVNAGQKVRYLEVPISPNIGIRDIHGFENVQLFISHFKDVIKNNCGTAGPAFVEHLEKDYTCIELAASEVLENLGRRIFDQEGNLPNSGQVQRALNNFSLIAWAGVLAVHYGILKLSVDEVIESVSKCFQEWLKGFGGDVEYETIDILKKILLYYETYSERINPADSTTTDPSKLPICNYEVKAYSDDMEGWYKTILIPSMIFERNVAPEYSYKQRIDALEKSGSLRRYKDRVKVQRQINGTRVTCIEICIEDIVEYLESV